MYRRYASRFFDTIRSVSRPFPRYDTRSEKRIEGLYKSVRCSIQDNNMIQVNSKNVVSDHDHGHDQIPVYYRTTVCSLLVLTTGSSNHVIVLDNDHAQRLLVDILYVGST